MGATAVSAYAFGQADLQDSPGMEHAGGVCLLHIAADQIAHEDVGVECDHPSPAPSTTACSIFSNVTAEASGDLDELEIKRQVLARQGMVGIERDGRIGQLKD